MVRDHVHIEVQDSCRREYQQSARLTSEFFTIYPQRYFQCTNQRLSQIRARYMMTCGTLR